jgi:hypothetical protein
MRPSAAGAVIHLVRAIDKAEAALLLIGPVWHRLVPPEPLIRFRSQRVCGASTTIAPASTDVPARDESTTLADEAAGW